MKKILYSVGIFVLLLIILVGFRSRFSTESQSIYNSKSIEIGSLQTGIGSVDNSNSFDKQKFQYKITLINNSKVKVNKKLITISLTDWIKQKQIKSKITNKTIDNKKITIQGYVIFDTKGLTKKDIMNHSPYIDGINVVSDKGQKIYIKYHLFNKGK